MRSFYMCIINFNNEVWKIVPSYPELKLEASTLGRIRNSDKIFNQSINGGYFLISVKYFNEHIKLQVHRLICAAFNKVPEDLEESRQFVFRDKIPHIVNHKDGNKLNNCPDNLEWTTNKLNTKHAYETGLWKFTLRINIKDISNNTTIIFNSVNEASRFLGIESSKVLFLCKLHEEVPYNERFLIKIENENFFNKEKRSSNEREIVVRNYRDNSVTIYRSINATVHALTVSKLTIVNNLGRFDRFNKDKLINGYIFRSIERILDQWPVYSEKEIFDSITKWSEHLKLIKNPDKAAIIVHCKSSGSMIKYPDLKTAVKVNGLVSKYSTSIRHFRKKDTPLELGDFVFSRAS